MFLLLLLSQRRPAATRHTCTCIERDNVTLEVTRQQRSCLISHPWLKLLSHHVITSAKQTPKSLLVSILLVDQAGTESVLTVSGAFEFTGCSSGRIPSYSLTWTCAWSSTIITTTVALQNTPRSCDPLVCWYSIFYSVVLFDWRLEHEHLGGWGSVLFARQLQQFSRTWSFHFYLSFVSSNIFKLQLCDQYNM